MNKHISCGINSTLCTRAHVAIFACFPYLSPDFLGRVASHSLGLYGDTVLEFYFTVGQLPLGQISFGLLPHHPKIHCREHIERIPLNTKLSSAWQTHDGTSNNNNSNNGFYKASYAGSTISKTLYIHRNQGYKIKGI